MGKERNLSTIDTLVIHCSATPNGRWFSAADIDRWHAKRNFRRNMSIAPHHAPDLTHIGYHYVILLSGVVECGRPEQETGAHVKGHNGNTIGTCLIGTGRYTLQQWDTLDRHVRSFQKRYPGGRVFGHRDFSPDLNGDGIIEPNEFVKLCPAFDVAEWIARDMRPTQEHIWPEAEA